MPEKTGPIAHRIQADYFKKSHPFRRLKLWLSIGAAGVAALWLLSAALMGYRMVYHPDELSNSHTLVGNNCAACHTGPEHAIFSRKVSDRACEVCHLGPMHHTNQIFAGVTGAQPPCASCHEEHRGRPVSPSLVRDDKCTQCHSALPHVTAAVPVSSDPKKPRSGFAPAVTSFVGDHPEFRVHAEHQKDQTPIKLNHKKHLRPDLPGPDGRPVQMQCTDCHRISAPGTTMAPVQFERDCMSCHPLQFDERIREQAPHEDPALVMGFVRTAFATYAGRNPNEWKRDAVLNPVRNLTELKRMADEAPRNLPQWLEMRIADSKRVLFEKKCQECHVVQNVNAPLPTVVNPEIPNIWFTHAQFFHAPHRMLQCGSCHKDVPESSLTTDVLVPNRGVCLQCHNTSAAPATCVTCHTYHDKSKPMPYPGALTPARLRTDGPLSK